MFIFRIILKFFNYFILSVLIFKIKNYSKKLNLKFSGPVFLPKRIEKFNILKSPHIYKNSRDQLEIKTYKIIFDYYNINKKNIFFLRDLFSYFNLDFCFKFLS